MNTLEDHFLFDHSILVCIVWFLDLNSCVKLLSVSNHMINNEFFGDIVGFQFNLLNIESQEKFTARSKVLTAGKIDFCCELCGSALDSIFGFFLYSSRCFNCEKNLLVHQRYSSKLKMDTETTLGDYALNDD